MDKIVARRLSSPSQNTAERFKFSSLCSRYQSLKRRWDETLRQIEDGTYTRHRFKAALHEREHQESQKSADGPAGGDLFASYLEARKSCGQDVKSLSPDRLDAMLAKQRKALAKKFGKTDFSFRVVVEDGRARLKASRVKKKAGPAAS